MALPGFRPLSHEQAIGMVVGATEKPHGVSPDVWLSGAASGETYLLGKVPVEQLPPNSFGSLFDVTVDETLALRYRRMSTEAPPVLVVQGRDGFLGLLDGGHRVTAARMRGDTSIPAIVIIPAPHDRHDA